ncbi:tripartite tricarboxylate transporter permease [Octadecabacter sp. R77987]|uniref:tripartite tricarboxylate transporter permease n=1 Tax=Octadecabacter sp. R77987 TaxID=3093874 RepID=UPI00366BFE56
MELGAYVFATVSALSTGWAGTVAAIVIGTLLGFIAGLVPGIGGRIGIILCLPIALFWDPLAGAVFLFAMHSVVHTSTSIPAIAFALPSTASDAATVIDGYPLAKAGRGGEALGASLSASAIGGVIGAGAFLLAIPVARVLLRWFGPPEFLILALFGLCMVTVLSGKNWIAGLLVACMGFAAALVGLDVQTSADRFTFGFHEISDGLNIAAVIGGLFVVPEMLSRFKFTQAGHDQAVHTRVSDVIAGMKTTLRHLGLVFRSSLYGIGIGLMPGLGSSVAVWLAYAYAGTRNKTGVPMGQGVIAGVIAPEAANNSKEGGAMVPTLFFGIPGSSSMAIMLGAFAVLGQPIGPTLLTTDVGVSYLLAATVLVANILAIPLFLLTVPFIVRLAALQRAHMVPFAIAISLFAATYQAMQVGVLFQFALSAALGLVLKRLEWSRPAFLLGFIMGPLAEISFIQTSQIWGWTMFLRPATIGLLVVFALLAWKAAKASARTFSAAQRQSDSWAAFAALLGFAGIFAQTTTFAPHASQVPALVAVIAMGLAVAIIIARRIAPADTAHLDAGGFSGIWAAILFITGVFLVGIPLASVLYALGVLIHMKVRWHVAVICSGVLGAAQLGLFSLTSYIWAEPLVIGVWTQRLL